MLCIILLLDVKIKYDEKHHYITAYLLINVDSEFRIFSTALHCNIFSQEYFLVKILIILLASLNKEKFKRRWIVCLLL